MYFQHINDHLAIVYQFAWLFLYIKNWWVKKFCCGIMLWPLEIVYGVTDFRLHTDNKILTTVKIKNTYIIFFYFLKGNMMVHVCTKFVVCRMSLSNFIEWRVPLCYGAPKSSARVGLKEGSEFFSLRYIGSK